MHRLGVTLNDMLGRLQAARDRERAFVSDASHELRTPLAIVKTEVEVALRTDNPPETLRAALRVVGEEADRLVNLAEDLLLVARSNAGRLDLDCRPVSARRLLEDVERRFRVRAREAGRQIAIQPTGDAAVLADVPRVEQALSNLVDNALRHGTGRSPCGHVPTVTGTSSCMSSTKGRGCLRASYRKPSSGSAAPSGDALEKAAAWGSRSSRSSPPHTAGERTWRTVASARARTPG